MGARGKVSLEQVREEDQVANPRLPSQLIRKKWLYAVDLIMTLGARTLPAFFVSNLGLDSTEADVLPTMAFDFDDDEEILEADLKALWGRGLSDLAFQSFRKEGVQQDVDLFPSLTC